MKTKIIFGQNISQAFHFLPQCCHSWVQVLKQERGMKKDLSDHQVSFTQMVSTPHNTHTQYLKLSLFLFQKQACFSQSPELASRKIKYVYSQLLYQNNF